MKSFLEEHEDYVLAETKSEVRKQECRADSLDSSVRDLQRLLEFNRRFVNTNFRFVDSDRKKVGTWT